MNPVDSEIVDNSPFFIIGSSRSGTTLLRLMIAGHSRIHIPPETWFLLPLVETFSLTEPLDAKAVAQAVSIITGHYRWPDMKMDADVFRQEASSLASPRLADIFDIICRRQLAAASKARFGDKTPLYIGIVPELSVMYPGAKFIHLIRDGRDVAISFIDADFEGRVYEGEKFEWINAVHKAWAYDKRPEKIAILEVRYEDLVINPEQTVRKVCEFLGERFEENMLNYAERVSMVPERGRQIHTKLAKPMKSEAIAVWKSKLSASECFVMEACLRRELLAMDYPLRFKSAAWLPLMAVTTSALRLSAPLLNRAIPALQRRNLLKKPVYF